MSEYYPYFGKYNRELLGICPDDCGGDTSLDVNDSNNFDWTLYERSFSITEQRWSEIMDVIECMQRAIRNGEDINSEAYNQVKQEAEEEELFGVPIMMTYGTIRPIYVNKFEKTRWNAIPEEFIDEEIVSGNEYFSTEHQIVTFRKVVRTAGGSIMLAIDGKGDDLELGVRIDELGSCEAIITPDVRAYKETETIPLDDDIRTLRIALENISTAKHCDEDREAMVESIMNNTVSRLKILKIGDQIQMSIPGDLVESENSVFINKDSSGGRLTICGTFEGVGMPDNARYPIGIKLSDIRATDKGGIEFFLEGEHSRDVLPVTKGLKIEKITHSL